MRGHTGASSIDEVSRNGLDISKRAGHPGP